MNCYILFNPHAGNGLDIEKVKHLSVLYNCDIIYKDITDISNYTEFFSQTTGDDIVVLCGGDGTINRFVNDTDGVDIPCDVLYCALGTGNDFLRDIGKASGDAPFSIKKYITDLPMVEVKGKKYRFINNVGFGIDGYCCQVGDELKKNSTQRSSFSDSCIRFQSHGSLPVSCPPQRQAAASCSRLSENRLWLRGILPILFTRNHFLRTAYFDLLQPALPE